MKIVKETDLRMDEVVISLERGGLVVYPTETVYGIGVDTSNQDAVTQLTNFKSRPTGKPYSIMVADQIMAEEYVELNETAKNLYKNFLPGPMTIISKMKTNKLARGVASEAGTVGIRISSYPLVTEIVKTLGRPISATSANVSYKKRPYKIADILNNISEKQKGLIDLIIDAGELVRNELSTVVDTTLDDPVVLRSGEFQISNFIFNILSRSAEDTKNLGKELWKKYEKYFGKRAIIFALEGEMGTGKTVFVKGLARAMGIEEEVVSPTFNLNNEYRNMNYEVRLDHVDTWRMRNPDELEALGLKGMINDKSVLAIEWANRVEDIIRKYNDEAVVIWIKIEYGKGENERNINWRVV